MSLDSLPRKAPSPPWPQDPCRTLCTRTPLVPPPRGCGTLTSWWHSVTVGGHERERERERERVLVIKDTLTSDTAVIMLCAAAMRKYMGEENKEWRWGETEKTKLPSKRKCVAKHDGNIFFIYVRKRETNEGVAQIGHWTMAAKLMWSVWLVLSRVSGSAKGPVSSRRSFSSYHTDFNISLRHPFAESIFCTCSASSRVDGQASGIGHGQGPARAPSSGCFPHYSAHMIWRQTGWQATTYISRQGENGCLARDLLLPLEFVTMKGLQLIPNVKVKQSQNHLCCVAKPWCSKGRCLAWVSFLNVCITHDVT